MDRADDAVPLFELLDERRHLVGVAHWMLGSSSEAETVIDETYRRWYELPGAARARISAPRSWLAKVAGGICLARLTPPGGGKSWEAGEGAGEGGEQLYEMLGREVGDVLRDALDSLSPAERAAFIVNAVFGAAPDAVAGTVGRSDRAEPTDRALRGLRIRRLRPATSQQHDAVVRAFRRACLAEDAALLASLLAPDATAFFDGGGKVRALVKPVHGNQQVARSLLALLPPCPRTRLRTRSVNGRTGLVVYYDHQVAAVISLDVADHHVIRIWVVLNPDKLRPWNQSGATASP
ncbi:RNA polymerase subunit sigma [Streptomyces sp. NPDC058914]|uniref:RNA polymerase subunit sigma n=1 Tax=Streptomyces TaxID=1883 RepID=UPI0036AF8E50